MNQNNEDNTIIVSDRRPKDWRMAKEFRAEIDHGRYSETIFVMVNKSDRKPFPEYTFRFGTVRNEGTQDERVIPFIGLSVYDQHLMKPELGVGADLLIEMIGEAKAWILEDAIQVAENYSKSQESEVLVARPASVSRLTGKSAQPRDSRQKERALERGCPCDRPPRAHHEAFTACSFS